MVFPAHAGVILRGMRPLRPFVRVPRACGGDPPGRAGRRILGVFPAHAGVILEDIEILKKLTGVPRACGGDPRAVDNIRREL